jgi:hypothetical protein
MQRRTPLGRHGRKSTATMAGASHHRHEAQQHSHHHHHHPESSSPPDCSQPGQSISPPPLLSQLLPPAGSRLPLPWIVWEKRKRAGDGGVKERQSGFFAALICSAAPGNSAPRRWHGFRPGTGRPWGRGAPISAS